MTIKFCLKTVVGIILAATIAMAAVVVIVPRMVNLGTCQAQILSAVQNAVGRRVSYKAASFSWLFEPSFVFRGITIAEKSGDSAFLNVERLTFKLALLPLLHKEVRLREIVVEQPVLTLNRNREGVFNFHDLLKEKPSEYTIQLTSVRINNARVRFTDNFLDTQGFSTSLENLDLYVTGLERGKTSSFKLSTMIPGERGSAAVTISGTARIRAQKESQSAAKFNVTLSAKNVDAGRYWPYYGHYLPCERLRGHMDIEDVFTGNPTEFTTKGRLSIRNLWFNYPQVFHAPLTPKDIRLAYDIKRTPQDLALKSLDLTVDGVRVTGSCALGDISSKDPRITARVTVSPFRLEEFRQYIPYLIIPTGTADFIEQHIKGGIYQLDEGSLDGRISQILQMERGNNYNVLLVRGRVDKGLIRFGPQVPTFNNIKGNLEMRGKDFTLSSMTGNFGGSPFTLEGKIADYPLTTPSSYPFTMTISPKEAEVAWLFRQERPSALAFSGTSQLRLSGAGSADDYRLAGSWDLSRAEYRYEQLIHKPAGMANQLRFSARLGDTEARLENLRYELPPLGVTANATYRYNARVPLSFAVATNHFMFAPDFPVMPGLREYHPSGSLQVDISGSGNPAEPAGMRMKGTVTLAGFSLQPLKQINPLTDISATIHVTEAVLESEQLTGKIGNTAFAAKGRVTGLASPIMDLGFTSPQLHPEDFGFQASGQVPEVKNLAGSISLKDRNLTISSLSGQIDNSIFTISGEVLDIGAPRITLRIDLPHLRVEDLVPLAGLKRAGTAEEQPHGITLKARLTSAAGSIGKISFQHLDTALSLEKDLLDIKALHVSAFSGTVSGDGRIAFAANGGPTYQTHYRLDHVDAAQLLRAAGAKPHLTGMLTAEGELTAQGKTPEELKNTARGSAEIMLNDGVLSLPAGAEQKTANEVPFKKVHTRLSYAGKVLDVHSASIDAFGGIISGNGGADFSALDGPGYRLSCQMTNIDAAGFFHAVDATRDMSGFLNLQADLTARGDQVVELKKTLQGSLKVHMEKGVINKFGLISKVFSILNLSDLLDYRLPDLMGTGMPYNRADGNFSFTNGKVSTTGLSLLCPSLNMTIVGDADIVNRDLDLKIGVQPFQTVGKVVSKIPIIGWILTGKKKQMLVAYYEAKGKWDDPKVSALPMESLSNGVYRIFKRAFNLPVKIITEPGEVILGNGTNKEGAH